VEEATKEKIMELRKKWRFKALKYDMLLRSKFKLHEILKNSRKAIMATSMLLAFSAKPSLNINPASNLKKNYIENSEKTKVLSARESKSLAMHDKVIEKITAKTAGNQKLAGRFSGDFMNLKREALSKTKERL
jgi:hypothetical protein